MTMFFIAKYITLFSLLALATTGYSSAEEATRSVRFYLFAESDTAMGISEYGGNEKSIVPRIEFCYFKQNEAKSVDLPASGFQGPFEATLLNNQLRIYDKSVKSLEQISPADLVAALVIPPTTSDVLLYSFRSISENQSKFVALGDMKQPQNEGKSFCINLTGKPIAVNIGTERALLKTNCCHRIDLKIMDESTLTNVKVAAEWRDSWKLAMSTTRRLSRDDSYLFLFKKVKSNPRSITLRLVKIPSFTPIEPE